MKKKILILLMVTVLMISVVGCKEEFDYKKAMEDSTATMQNAKKMDVSSNIVFNDDFGEKIKELVALDPENEVDSADIDLLTNILSNIEFVVDQKVDLDAFVMSAKMALNYEESNFVSLDMFLNDSMLVVNEPNLLKQGAMIKFDFIKQMIKDQGMLPEDMDFIKLIKDQVVIQQDLGKKIMPIINRIIDENIDEPEVLETEISFNGKDIKTNEVKYVLTYRKALELSKIFLQDEEFITEYKTIMTSQFEYMNSLYPEDQGISNDEMIVEFENSITEMVEGIDEVLAMDTEETKILDSTNLTISYYFDDGLKKMVYDFDFITISVNYNSIGEEIVFDIPTEESSYVIEDQMGLFGITGIVNMDKIEELQNHKLVNDIISLENLFN
jgi:hypothetical protein